MHLSHKVNSLIPLTVGKSVIAIAWADGVIQPEEVNCIHSMLDEMPDIPNEQMELLNDLLERPLQATECEVLIDELAGLLNNREERNFAIYWLDKMVNSKGKPDADEQKMYNNLTQRLMGDAEKPKSAFCLVKKPSSASSYSDIREHINEIMNEWIIIVRGHIPELDLHDDQLKEIIMVGLIQGRIILADNRIDEEEADLMISFFMNQWSLNYDLARKLAKRVLAQKIEDDEDIILICQELQHRSTKAQLEKYADTLFMIGATKDGLCEKEINEITSMTASLGMNHIYFAGKLRRFARAIEAANTKN